MEPDYAPWFQSFINWWQGLWDNGWFGWIILFIITWFVKQGTSNN